jgi:hypothetical protein
MIKHIKRLLGIGQEPAAPAPYKVETPAETTPFPAPKTTRKPSVKKATTAKPRKPKAPKA